MREWMRSISANQITARLPDIVELKNNPKHFRQNAFNIWEKLRGQYTILVLYSKGIFPNCCKLSWLKSSKYLETSDLICIDRSNFCIFCVSSWCKGKNLLLKPRKLIIKNDTVLFVVNDPICVDILRTWIVTRSLPALLELSAFLSDLRESMAAS